MKRVLSFIFLAVFSLSLLSQNLIRNPEFLEGVESSGIPVGWVRDTSDSMQYESSVVVEDGASAFRLNRLSEKGEGLCRISQYIDNVQGGANYIFSAEVKTSGTGGDLIMYDFFPNGKYQEQYLSMNRADHGWQTLVKSFQASPNCKRMKLSLLATKADGAVFYRNVKLVCADDAPQMVLKELSVAPSMEANWEDPIWGEGEESAPYALLGKEFLLPNSARATFSKFGIHKGVLQVITYAKEGDMAGRTKDREGWNNDTIEVFLREPATRITYHVGVSATGEQCADVVNLDRVSGFAKDMYSADTTTASIEGVENINFTSAMTEQEFGWVAQFAIPLDQQVLKNASQIQVLLVRNRKVRGKEEYSSWGRTTSTFFKDSSGFVTLSLPVTEVTESSSEVLSAESASAPETQVIPAPQKAAFGESVHALSLPLVVHVPESKAFLMARQMLDAQLKAPVNRSTSQEEAQISLEIVPSLQGDEFAGLSAWQRREAYRLETGKAVRILAESHRGLVNGLASFCQLCAYDDQGRLAFREGRISDWPDLEYRGWHTLAPGNESEMAPMLQFIDTLAALKFNWFSLQFDTRFQYERHPEMGSPKAPSKDDHRKIAQRLELYDIQVIPMTQCFSHFRDFLVRPELRHLAEKPEADEKAQFKYWNYCPRHPEIHQRICDMIEEHLECYPNAKWYHAGLDEVSFEEIGICPRCKGTPGAELFANEVLFLHDFITKKGLRMCMWCDQLEVQRTGGKEPNRTVDALPKIPRDIVIFDWHYDETDKNSTVEFMKEQGFDVMSCAWYYPRDVMCMATAAYKQKVLGYGGTTWTWTSEIRKRPHLMTAAILGAERSWNGNGPTLENLPYIPVTRFQQIYDGRSPEQAQKFRIVDLIPFGNMSLNGNTRFSWMGLDEDNDCSALLAGIQWLDGTPYRIQTGNHAVLATACETKSMRDFPKAISGIPVGGNVKELRFLQTASRPNVVIRAMNDEMKEKPILLGYYVIHYADGQMARVALEWEKTISQWNAQLPSAFCQVAWHGKTKAGAVVTLETLRWVNPRPEVPVLSVDLESTNGKSAPVLLAITTVE